MTYENKFKIPRPTRKQLAVLSVLVHEILDLINQHSPLVTETLPPLITEKLLDLNTQLTSPTDLYEIICYGALSTEEFLEFHLIPYPSQHQNLSDNELLWLIAEIQENIEDAFVTRYYAQILDFNTSSPSGSTKALIYQDLIPETVLRKLKENRMKVIHL